MKNRPMRSLKSALLLMGCALVLSCSNEPAAPEVSPDAPAAQSAPTHQNINPGQAQELLAGEVPPTVLDIRTQFEVNAGQIEGSLHLDYYAKTFREELGKLDRDKPIIVHCRSGGRSTESLGLFKELGFKNVYHLDGGILAWEKSGLGLIKPTP